MKVVIWSSSGLEVYETVGDILESVTDDGGEIIDPDD